MENTAEYTKVKFVKESSGEILAIFPELKEGPNSVSCYAHNGQHSIAGWDYINSCKPINKHKALIKELQSLGYHLIPYNE